VSPFLLPLFRKGREGNDAVKLDDLKKVHQQLDYTNTALTVVATQLNHVAIRVEETKMHVQVPSIPAEDFSYTNSISKPFFKTDSIP